MARGITLTRSEPVLVQHEARNDGWRIVIEASAAEMMPLEVFVFQRGVLNARTQVVAAEFMSVASPVGLTTIPVDEPGELDYPPLYRSKTLDAIVPSSQLAEKLWESVVIEVQNLVAALDRMDRLDEIETIRCGAPEESS